MTTRYLSCNLVSIEISTSSGSGSHHSNTKYEKVQWITKPKLGSETGILKSGMMAGVKLPSRIVLSLCADYEEYGRQCIPSFEAKLPQYYLEDDDVTTSQWTILRELD
jgi:hypothetical protein